MRNVFLTGFMGTGKTAVGRALARRLGLRFVDLDEEVERTSGLPVAEIFARFARFFEDVLAAAVVAGDVGEIDIPAAASALVAYYEGIMLLGKTSGGTQELRNFAPAAPLLATFGTAPRATGTRVVSAKGRR